MKFDIFFKTALLIIAAFVGFSIVQHVTKEKPQVGRFVPMGDESTAILDTATGAVYNYDWEKEDKPEPVYLIQEPILK